MGLSVEMMLPQLQLALGLRFLIVSLLLVVLVLPWLH